MWFGAVLVAGLATSAVASVQISISGPAAVTVASKSDGLSKGRNKWVAYAGDGSAEHGWPKKSQWVSFEYMWKANKKNLYNGCKEHNVEANTEAEIADIFKAIQQVAKESKVDHRFILAEILQESTACVRVPTTKAPGDVEIFNPGLMQDHGGRNTCHCATEDEYNQKCGVVKPCPASLLVRGSQRIASDFGEHSTHVTDLSTETILGMLRDGVQGTAKGDGLTGLITKTTKQGAKDAQIIYAAAWYFNQGDTNKKVGQPLGQYAQDIANRLTGWLGDKRA